MILSGIAVLYRVTYILKKITTLTLEEKKKICVFAITTKTYDFHWLPLIRLIFSLPKRLSFHVLIFCSYILLLQCGIKVYIPCQSVQDDLRFEGLKVLFTTRPLTGVYVKLQHEHMSKIHVTAKTIRRKLHG